MGKIINFVRRDKIFRSIYLGFLSLMVFHVPLVDASEQPSHASRCLFRGEIFYAPSYEGILIFRANDSDKPEQARQYAPLYPGDYVTVAPGQQVQIRDRPGQSPRLVTAVESPFHIAEPTDCSLSPDWLAVMDILDPMLRPWANSAAAAEPRLTTPRGDETETALTLPFSGEQKLVSGTRQFDVRWKGPAVNLVVRRKSDGKILAQLQHPTKPFDQVALAADIVAGEHLTLELSSKTQATSMAILVMPETSLPLPPNIKVASVASQDEKAVYALWLALQGPSDWRLYGYSQLAASSANNLMSWKIWRAVAAGEMEK